MTDAATSTPTIDEAALEEDLLRLGRQLARQTASQSIRTAVRDRLARPVNSDRSLRQSLLRVVDVAPSCVGAIDLTDHLEAMVSEGADSNLARALVRACPAGRAPRTAVGGLIREAVRRVGGRFILAEDIAGASSELEYLWRRGVAASVDLLGEASVSHQEAESYAAHCDEALTTLSIAARAWPARPLLERDSTGPLARVNLSVKVSALTPLVRAEAPERGRTDLSTRLRDLLRRARDVGAHVHVDMESLDTRELTLSVVLDLLAEPEFADGPSAGLVLQAYARDSEATLVEILNRVAAMSRATPLAIRLVKGAYWDYETLKASQNGWISPVWDRKYESDRCFERLSRLLIDAYPTVRTAVASHNLRSVAHAIAYARRSGLAPSDIEIQVLRGLGDDLQDAAVAAGLRVRTYCPVGNMLAGMGYLVRRLLENSSNDSFLAQSTGTSRLDQLLRRP